MDFATKPSTARLFEDTTALGRANAEHADVHEVGKGHFLASWGEAVYISTSDNSDLKRDLQPW